MEGIDSYFIIVRAEDEDKLKLSTVKLVKDYIVNAPGGVGTKAPAARYRKVHRKRRSGLVNEAAENGPGAVKTASFFFLFYLPKQRL